jgi:predicted amidohydrolase
MRVGLCQLRTPVTREAALAQASDLIREAATKGAKVILTPECTNVVQRDRSALLPTLKTQNEDDVVVGLAQLATELDIHIIVGSALVLNESGKPVNRQLVVSPAGTIVAYYDKMHMFDVDLPTGETARESAVYEPGSRAVLTDIEGVKFGLSICYDVRFAAVYRALAQAGAQILTIPAAFTRPTGEAHWHVLLRARAIETGSFVLAAAQGGFHEDGRGTYGHSIIIAPWGAVIGELEHDEPGVLVADLDLSEVTTARRAVPALVNGREFTGP